MGWVERIEWGLRQTLCVFDQVYGRTYLEAVTPDQTVLSPRSSRWSMTWWSIDGVDDDAVLLRRAVWPPCCDGGWCWHNECIIDGSSTIGQKIWKCARTLCNPDQKTLSQLHPKGEYPCNYVSDPCGIPYSQWSEGGNHRLGWIVTHQLVCWGRLRMLVGVRQIGEARLGPNFGWFPTGAR